jgi:hypothetical protein
VEDRLGPAHREDGDEHGAATVERAVDGVGELLGGVSVRVAPVAVRRFGDEVVGCRQRRGRRHDRVDGAAHVTGERDRTVGRGDVHGGRAEDVTDRAEGHGELVDGRERLAERRGAQLPQAPLGVSGGVERQGGVVAARMPTVGDARVLFVQVRRVEQHDLGQRLGRGRAPDRTGEAVTGEGRQGAGVVDVGVREDHGVDRRGIDGEALPVPLPEPLDPLEEPAVDEHAAAADVDQVA